MAELGPEPLPDTSDGGWRNYAPIIHTFPVDDEIEHDLDDHDGGCVCGPRVERDGDTVQVVHAALDGRELTEDDEEELWGE